MATTIPPSITALPAAPDPNNRATFNTLAYPWSAALPTFGTQVSAVATNVKANADDAATSASTATTGAGTATTQAGISTTGAGTATTKAAEAVVSAAAAETSRVQASKLNLGSYASAPTLDNQGAALLTGATYYDTTLTKWRVYSGSAWVDGIASVAGVSSINGLSGAVTNPRAGSLKSATTDVDVMAATAPSAGQILTATSSTAAAWQTPTPGVPVGAEMLWPTETPPTGWLEENGASLLRAGAYASLFSVIGTTYGAADGTHFNLPDSRGRFLRVWANGATTDPDRASRTTNGVTGATMTAGDRVGTNQVDGFKAHTHTAAAAGSSYYGNNGSAFDYSGSTGSTGGNETRPINTYRMMIIKY